MILFSRLASGIAAWMITMFAWDVFVLWLKSLGGLRRIMRCGKILFAIQKRAAKLITKSIKDSDYNNPFAP
jgi:hypothetical protein